MYSWNNKDTAMQHTRGVILLCRYIGSSLPQLNIDVKIDLIEF